MDQQENMPLRKDTEIRDTEPKNIIDGSSQEDQLEKLNEGEKSKNDGSKKSLFKHIDQPEDDDIEIK